MFKLPTSILLASLALAACGGGSSDDDSPGGGVDAAGSGGGMVADAAVPDAAPPDAAPPDAMPPDAMPPGGVTVSCEAGAPGPDHHQYVFNTLAIPTSASTAQSLGLDLDGDPMARPDNGLGQVIATLASTTGEDLQAIMDDAIASGAVRHVLDVTAPDLTTTGPVTAQTFAAGDCDDPANPADDFSGIETFGPLPDALTDAVLTGTATGGVQVQVAGAGPIEVTVPFLGGVLVRLPLSGAMLEATVSGGEIVSGKLGGGISEADIDAVFIPALATGLQDQVDADCTPGSTPCCLEGSTGETLIDLFDDDADCKITADELRANDLISSLLAPDVDLFDGTGAYAPRVDGVNDSLSLGIGFTAVPAVLPIAPPE